MKRRILAFTCCSVGLLAVGGSLGTAAAQTPGVAVSNRSLADLFRPQGAFPAAAGPLSTSPEALTESELVGHAPSDHDRLEAFAAKVSYAGLLLLTADRMVRSMDSVLEQMKITRADGTQMRLEMGPTSDGMSVGLRVSRPIEF